MSVQLKPEIAKDTCSSTLWNSKWYVYDLRQTEDYSNIEFHSEYWCRFDPEPQNGVYSELTIVGHCLWHGIWEPSSEPDEFIIRITFGPPDTVLQGKIINYNWFAIVDSEGSKLVSLAKRI